MAEKEKKINDNYIFGLDIGTRSIVGVVGHETSTGFHVDAFAIEYHETRSMIDGQIHDIDEVAKTIGKVKLRLEKKLRQKLDKVCIAAAGRVLKTLQVSVDHMLSEKTTITDEMIVSVELLGIEKAMREMNGKRENEDTYYCVGYSVTNYLLDDFILSNLEGHKGQKISANVLTTFLPIEVVNSLYEVIRRAGLTVYSLTLEPIAAIEVAIPKEFRLLNIALVDIGAGTSDIAITKAGSVVAYGMIPFAGDEITESIVHKYLVDFKTAETMKIKSSGRTKTISYKDAIGIKHTIDKKDVLETIEEAQKSLAEKIAEKIKELNGGEPTNAVFIVGGGGQVKDFDKMTAECMTIPKERVALRGKEVLQSVTNDDPSFKRNPEFVTPIGICLTGLHNNQNDFIEVYLNDETMKVFNTNHLTIMDVVALKGMSPSSFIAKRGESITITVNNEEKVIKGEVGIPAKIFNNQKEVTLTSPIKNNDYITIIPAKNGKDAKMNIKDILNKETFLTINEGKKLLQPKIYLNNKEKSVYDALSDGDVLNFIMPTVGEVLESYNIKYEHIFVNEEEVTTDYITQQEDVIVTFMNLPTEEDKEKESENVSGEESKSVEIHIIINGQVVKLSGKKKYIFVDIFDFYEFDTMKPKGVLITLLNGEKAEYMQPIEAGDKIELYWK